ncbi:MAG: flagellar export protein FliJ [Sulfurimonas sp.]|nr:flagellar export protein FliJ [Sulfurimonas sp.]
MRTRYSPLVKLKKSTMDKSERVVQKANADLSSATIALKVSYDSLDDIKTPTTGSMNDLLASRSLFSSQRDLIDHNKGWIAFAKKQVNSAKVRLRLDMVEYEKFKYLEFQEIKKMKYEIKIKETKEMDEVALMTYDKKVV